jgi:hypothetical protein
MWDRSPILNVAEPVTVSIVPLGRVPVPGSLSTTFTTHVDVTGFDGFGIGRGAPK